MIGLKYNMRGKLMNNIQIQYFLAVANNKSFSKAAKELFISQPALSKTISNLEKEFEVFLFDRTSKSSTELTPAGDLLYDFFSKFMNDFNENLMKARLISGQKTGNLRICFIEGWDLPLFLQNVEYFNTHYPYINVTIESTSFKELSRGLESNNFDLAICMDVLFKNAKNYNIRVITEVPNIVLYSSKHPLADKKSLDLSDFKDEILYVLSSDETHLALEINEAICKSKGFVPKIKLMTNADSILLALNSGKGYTILDFWSRARSYEFYNFFTLDTSTKISFVWKKNNVNPALSLFLKRV